METERRSSERQRTGSTVMEEHTETQPASKRRMIRSHYSEIVNRINEEKDDIANGDLGNFISIMNEVETIHKLVEKPRELVADAEALLGLTRTLLASVKAQSIGGVTPAEFVSCLIREFGQHKTTKVDFAKSNTISWKSVGTCVSPAFMNGSGCMGMLGPMKNGLKPSKLVLRRKRPRAEAKARPAELDKDAGVITDTDRNMQVMFEILKKEKKAKVENLMLNRNSFAQTVENLFALSFLVKDGRVCIDVDERGTQFAVPRNGPSAKDIKSGVAKNHQFIFRFDSGDWQCMKSCVAAGEELMAAKAGDEKCRQFARDSQAIPVKKLSRNCVCVAIPNGIPT